ncbi:glyoxalase [Paenibacillus selenitireducens]|uniref:Glyoxalase n=1 Tax=Paenibacillus selenitireducens TaxID=1324314 RepID=A0A1T2XL20_9BACL|nr:VOC family protein [Paenibacillus selenitireducens]OPA80522.1 glyoxalase [Paenibacillus selenitireducens]
MSKVGFSVQVLLVSNLEQSQAFYRDVLGCDVTDFWAVRDDFALGFKLMQADQAEDVKPNKPGRGQLIPWDTYAYVETHQELDQLYQQLKDKGAGIVQEPSTTEADWGSWKEFAIKDPDSYVIAFGSGKKD